MAEDESSLMESKYGSPHKKDGRRGRGILFRRFLPLLLGLALVLMAAYIFHVLFGFSWEEHAQKTRAGVYADQARAVLTAFHAAQSDYKTKNGHFTDELAKLDFDVELTKIYSIGFIDASEKEFAKYCTDCSLSEKGYKAAAMANLDEDEDLDVWTIDQDGHMEHPAQDL